MSKKKRSAGILLPVSSLPSQYGIGCFSKEAYQFIDELEKAKQSYWQILPLGATGYGDSPYQSFSTFAGNPYFIDLEVFITDGLLTLEECEKCKPMQERYVDYEFVYFTRFEILKKAFARWQGSQEEEYLSFCEKESYWLDDYAIFMAVKDYNGGKSFIDWEESIKTRKPEAMEKYANILSSEIQFYKFLQFNFTKQWMELKSYANAKGVEIIGDIPIYVAFDSVDTWSAPQLYEFTKELEPIGVAGCPPDGFSATGQLWGNPLYNWPEHKKTNYAWWIKRVQYCLEIYDVVRIDHFRGFDEYYKIPYGHETAEHGWWEKGPGFELFAKIQEELGECNIIAEDLGFLTPSVIQLLQDTKFPGMKILQFAFDSREESDYLPHNYNSNSVVYTGTHDNDTMLGWYESICQEDKRLVFNYLGIEDTASAKEVVWSLIKLAMGSVASMCIIPIQDYLFMGSEARINIPSTLGLNWKWRLEQGDISNELVEEIANVTVVYGRKA